jgi:hypothetical protein
MSRRVLHLERIGFSARQIPREEIQIKNVV